MKTKRIRPPSVWLRFSCAPTVHLERSTSESTFSMKTIGADEKGRCRNGGRLRLLKRLTWTSTFRRPTELRKWRSSALSFHPAYVDVKVHPLAQTPSAFVTPFLVCASFSLEKFGFEIDVSSRKLSADDFHFLSSVSLSFPFKMLTFKSSLVNEG